MKYTYFTKEGQFETDNYDEIPFKKLHSLNDKPSFENLTTGYKIWFFEGKFHRETGPARIFPHGRYAFYLHNEYYKNVNDWLDQHPNQNIEFQAFMRLKYT